MALTPITRRSTAPTATSDEPRADRRRERGAGQPPGGVARDEPRLQTAPIFLRPDGPEPSARRSSRRTIRSSTCSGSGRSKMSRVAEVASRAARCSRSRPSCSRRLGAAHAADEPELRARRRRLAPSFARARRLVRVIYTRIAARRSRSTGGQGSGFWLRVVLPDGRIGYALGDEVQIVRRAARRARRSVAARPLRDAAARGRARRLRDRRRRPRASRSPTARRERSATSRSVRRSSSTARSRLDGFVGDALTADGSQILYGGGAHDPLRAELGDLSVPRHRRRRAQRPSERRLVRPEARGSLRRARGRRLLDGASRPHPRAARGDEHDALRRRHFKNAQTYAGGFGVYF